MKHEDKKNVLIFPAVLNKKSVRNNNKTRNKQKRSEENKQQKQENDRKDLPSTAKSFPI